LIRQCAGEGRGHDARHRDGWRNVRLRPWLVGSILIVCAPWLHAREAAPVAIASAERTQIVEEIPLTGSITSPNVSVLAPEVEGRLASLEVDAGDRVARGDRLAALDGELARLDLEQAQAVVREAEVALDDARRRLREVRNLAEEQNVAETEVRAREAEVRRDAAVLDRRRAERARAEALLERHALQAPFAGAVARRMGDLGEWVGPGTPILELVQVDRLRLDLRVPQRYFGRIGRGTRVRVRLDALAERELVESVTDVVPVTDPDARTFLARAVLDNEEGRMAPGMSARAILELDAGRTGVVVSRDALIRYPDGRITVWIAEGEGATRTVTEQRVRTGLTFGDRVEIRKGLEAGTPVVVQGNEALRENQSVRIRQAVSDAARGGAPGGGHEPGDPEER